MCIVIYCAIFKKRFDHLRILASLGPWNEALRIRQAQCFPDHGSHRNFGSEGVFYIFLKQYQLYPACQSSGKVTRSLQAAGELLGRG